jgi:nucleoside-triphosphatase THEP1
MPQKRPSFIITGPSNGGKSTLCWKVLQHLKNSVYSVGGVITLQDTTRWFYLVQSYKRIAFEATSGEKYLSVGKYQISKSNLEQAILHIQDGLNCHYLFIDEIGTLEREGKGYYPVLKKAFERDEGNIFVVRESILKEIVDHYNPEFDYQLLRITNKEIQEPLKMIKAEII